MSDGSSVVAIAAFLVSFKAVLIEGSEVAILSVATVKQLGRKNVLLGMMAGVAASAGVFVVVSTAFSFFPEGFVDVGTGLVILYFSYRFLRGFRKYYFGKKSFRDKMKKMEDEVVDKDLGRYGGEKPAVVPFSLVNSLPVFAITLTEGFEASLVLGASGVQDPQFTVFGALVSVALLLVVSAVSYEYLLRVPRWALDLIGGTVLLVFGGYFLVSGVLLLL